MRLSVPILLGAGFSLSLGSLTRISPFDGSLIALPTAEQLAMQDREIGILIHFEMGTYLDPPLDGCNSIPTLVPNTTLFNPTKLDTDQWMAAATALGAKYATLVAKHNCGFTLWPSNITFPVRGGGQSSYNYTVAQSPLPMGTDVVKGFVSSAEKSGLGHGFYYSTVVNNYLAVQNSVVNATTAPGQIKISNATYDEIVLAQVKELWSNYGNLTEIWFDGGYSSSQKAKLEALLTSLQPNSSVFNACDVSTGTCLSPSPIRWIGTEAGEAPVENWSTGITPNGGSTTSPVFAPSECDTTLQTGTRWFWGPNQKIRSLKELIDVYHKTVGRNCLLEMDLTPDRTGRVPDAHVQRYKELGDFVKGCYGKPVVPSVAGEAGRGTYDIQFDTPQMIDRVVMMEDQTEGQVIRTYEVWGTLANGTMQRLSMGKSVGHKRIDIFPKPVSVLEVMINGTFVDIPRWKGATVHFCANQTVV